MIRIVRSGQENSEALILDDKARTLTPREFNSQPFARRFDLVRAARGRRKYELILDAVDAEQLVAQLPAQDLYLLIAELGIEDVAELYGYATTEQLTAIFDLAVWQDDLLDPEASLSHWRPLFEAGEEKVMRTAQEMDFALLAVMIGKQVSVSREEEGSEEDGEQHGAMRRDGGYEFAYRDPEHSKEVAALLDILVRHDQELFLRLMETLRWESGILLEEEAYEGRCRRLLELGFPAPVEAKGIYARIDPQHFAAGAARKRPLTSYGDEPTTALVLLEYGHPAGVLAGVLANGLDESIGDEFVYLINKVLAADRAEVGEVKVVRATVDRVLATVNLALEHLGGQEPATAGRFLAEYYVEDLFRLGFSLTLDLQRRARTLLAAPIAPFLDGPFRSGVTALGRDLPLMFEGIVAPERTGERLFCSAGELAAAATWLAGVEAQRRFFEEIAPFALPADDFDLSGCEPGAIEDLTLSELFLTALANSLTGREFRPEPFPTRELGALHARVSHEGRLDSALRQATVARFEAAVPQLGEFAAWSLDLWQEGFCAVPVGQLDPRYIDGLIVRCDAR